MDTEPELPRDALVALQQGRKIDAIKAVRMATGMGLKESKEAVEAYLEDNPQVQRQMALANAENARGGLRWLIWLGLVGLLAYWYLKR